MKGIDNLYKGSTYYIKKTRSRLDPAESDTQLITDGLFTTVNVIFDEY